jgi:hypothetical protein
MFRGVIFSFLILLLASSWVLVSTGRAQWLQGYEVHCIVPDADFDRPRVRPNHTLRPLSVPISSFTNWPFPNIDVTNSSGFAQNEPSIAINPLDSNNIIIGANDDRNPTELWAYSSKDGGLTWLNQPLQDASQWVLNALATDPSIAFDANGTVYYVNGRSDDSFFQNDVACFRSVSKGDTWNAPSEVFNSRAGNPLFDTISDKFYLAADRNPGSGFRGRLYVAWVDQGESELGYDSLTRIVCAYSTNGGVSWSHRSYVSGRSNYTSPIPAIEPDGTLLVTFIDHTIGSEAIFIARSTDGGVSFSSTQKLANYKNLGPVIPDDENGYAVIRATSSSGIDSLLLLNSFSSIAIDPSSLHPGRAYVTWCAKNDDDFPHVWLTTSDDDGVHWSTPKPIDNDTLSAPVAKFFSWIAVDPKTGNLGIDYYAVRSDTIIIAPGNNKTYLQADLYLAHSTDGGASFATRRISDVSFDPITGQDYRYPENTTLWFLGDYIGLAGMSNTWYPAWTDSRSCDEEIYTAIVQPFAPMPITNLTATDTTIEGKSVILLTWQYTPETTFGYPLSSYQFEIVKDNLPDTLLDGTTLSFLDTNVQQGHHYAVRVTSGGYRSAPDTIVTSKATVREDISSSGLAIHFANEPGIAGQENVARIQSDRATRIELTFYDELGRATGSALTDDQISTQHEINFTPSSDGVKFYILRAFYSNGIRAISGRIVALEQ